MADAIVAIDIVIQLFLYTVSPPRNFTFHFLLLEHATKGTDKFSKSTSPSLTALKQYLLAKLQNHTCATSSQHHQSEVCERLPSSRIPQ